VGVSFLLVLASACQYGALPRTLNSQSRPGVCEDAALDIRHWVESRFHAMSMTFVTLPLRDEALGARVS